MEKKPTEAAGEKLDKLVDDVLPRKEKLLEAVSKIAPQLKVNADQTRDAIRASGERAIRVVQAYVQEKLQQVDDVVAARRIMVDEQLTDVKKAVDGMIEAVALGDKLGQQSGTTNEEWSDLEERVRALLSLDCVDGLRTHPRMDFGVVDDDTLRAQAALCVGDVHDYDAYAPNCRVVGDKNKRIKIDREISFVFEARDFHDEVVAHTDVQVHPQYTKIPHGVTAPDVRVRYLGQPDGYYQVSLTPVVCGEYVLEVVVDGQKLPFEFTTQALEWLFDREQIGSLYGKFIIVDDDAMGIECTHDDDEVDYSYAFIPYSMVTGRHSWTVSIKNVRGEYEEQHLLGIIPRELAETRADEQWFIRDKACCRWNNCQDRFSPARRSQADMIPPFEEDDKVRLDYDCEREILKITHLPSGEFDLIRKIPKGEYWPMFGFCYVKTRFLLEAQRKGWEYTEQDEKDFLRKLSFLRRENDDWAI